MKQTAVEWLDSKIDGVVNSMIQGNRLVVRKAIQQAKEMEKQQITDARVKKPLDSEYKEAEQYYNETFNK